MADTEVAGADTLVTPTVPPPDAEEKKRNKWATKDTSEYPYVKWNWSDGTQTVFDVTSMSQDDQNQSTLHGASQKLGDAYSGAKTLEQAKALFDKALETIRTKGFTARVEGQAEEPVELLAQAVTLALQDEGVQPELADILEQVRNADKKQRSMWKNVDSVAMHLARLRKHAEQPNLDAFKKKVV
jgi:hypothetical protein